MRRRPTYSCSSLVREECQRSPVSSRPRCRGARGKTRPDIPRGGANERDAHQGKHQARRLPPYLASCWRYTDLGIVLADEQHLAGRAEPPFVLPGGAPNRTRVAAPGLECTGVAESVPARTETNATLGSGIGESAPGNAEDLGRTDADGATVVDGMPVPTGIPNNRPGMAV